MNTLASGVTWSAYPVGLTMPDGVSRHRCKVYATPEGLFVYWAVPTSENSDDPDWFSPIDYARTGRPMASYAMRNGWEIWTEAGLVIVTTEGGCGCGWPLKRWAPQFARKRLAWPARAANV